MGAVNNIIE